MISINSQDWYAWIAALLWPLVRILGMITASPVLGNRTFPARAKVLLGLALTLLIAPLLPPLPASIKDPLSLNGMLILAQQFLIGIGIGLSMRIVFAAVEMAGESIGLTMGLGFATFFDPQSQGRSSAIAQFLALLATLSFLAIDGHLLMIQIVVETFITLPISDQPVSAYGFKLLADWGAKLFSAGLQLALPILCALLLVNIALGILTRAAPQLNIFGIGFPLTLGLGFLMLTLILPYLSMPLQTLLNQGFEQAREVPRKLQQREPRPPAPAPALPAARP
ncbi:flagellar biosynthetic protein FliR [Massilia sp. W12]|uniref:flagellar biosynthetic protein FliR n=1 Tax=Massilia sp. W12 TaxID=3126507 RepID=UPI0030CBA508